ncbi:MAG: outer membrane lipoprotein carrier protein LolA, partial [Alphaproteobacteria bacterium]|nr:outer membrane lipoprotein carrier protein LolA [Alphaproteobacteria bacterium]
MSIVSRLAGLAPVLISVCLVLPGGGAAAFSPNAEQQAEIGRVERYLNGTVTLQARFSQIAPDGEVSEGTFYLRRPGRLRFEYDPPNPVLVMADGVWLIYHDRELG